MSHRIDGFSRIRAKLDISKKIGPMNDELCGDPGRFARGAALRFEILLVHGATMADPSQIAASHLIVLSSSDPDSAIGMDKTIGPSYINAGVTQAQWDAGDPEHCHLRFEFTSSETAEGVFTGTLADADENHWFRLTHGSGDALLFAGTVKSFDAGYTASGTPPLSGTAASIEQVRSYIDAALAQYVRFVGNPAGATIETTSAVGGLKTKVGTDSNGDFGVITQTTT